MAVMPKIWPDLDRFTGYFNRGQQQSHGMSFKE
jgi:hypothetical protein